MMTDSSLLHFSLLFLTICIYDFPLLFWERALENANGPLWLRERWDCSQQAFIYCCGVSTKNHGKFCRWKQTEIHWVLKPSMKKLTNAEVVILRPLYRPCLLPLFLWSPRPFCPCCGYQARTSVLSPMHWLLECTSLDFVPFTSLRNPMMSYFLEYGQKNRWPFDKINTPA